ncbi:MAG: hypothetical protein IKN85_00320 [Oscillospiraceae bacterium]|nr:hypothetical protein [Oscillospiraceae bacterium]
MGVVFGGAVAMIYIGLLVFSLALSVVMLVARYKLFEKAGEAGWKAIIPFYWSIILSKIATGKKTLGAVFVAAYSVFWIAYISFYYRQMVMLMGNLEGSMSASDAASIMLFSLFVMVLSISMAVLNGILMFKFAKSYGKSEGWCVAMIFLSGILIIAMGFDKELKYVGPNGVPTSDQYGVDNYNNYNY